MTDVSSNGFVDLFKSGLNALGGLLLSNNRELIEIIRQPTPIKVVANIQASGSGVIGGGFSNPQPVPLYQCPVSQEGWINRITISAQGYTPGNPLQSGQGQIWVSGSTFGEPIFWLPLAGVVAPIQITEGRLSAAHLNSGETMGIIGDSLPANLQLRFDFQLTLVTGVSQYTPRIPNLLDVTP